MKSKKNIPFAKTHIPPGTLGEIGKVFRSGWIATGPKTAEFETAFCNVIGNRHGVAVSSCTAALHLAYSTLNIKPGDEVIVPSFTFCSTINMLIHIGAIPVFCDIDENTLCLNPSEIIKIITAKTKAIVVVHFAGMPALMDEINSIAKKHNLKVIEDAAHAFLTKYKDKYVGSGNNLTCFSFYATKNLTTAEGGMVVTNSTNLAENIRILSRHGMTKQAWSRYETNGSWKYDVIAPGYKYNFTDIQAAIGLKQLEHAEVSRNIRLKLVNHYFSELSDNPRLLLPTKPTEKGSEHAWHLFTIRLTSKSQINRDDLIFKLKEKGVGTSVHFIPNHLQSYYKNTSPNRYHLPVTESVYQNILSLPLYEDLKSSDITYIAKIINQLV